MNKRNPKGTPTSTNLFVLRRYFDGRDVAPAKCEAVHFQHLSRCLKAGLMEACEGGVRLTDAGRAAIGGAQ